MQIKAEHIGHKFRQRSIVRECLPDISITINAGEFHCIIGKSGEGKSTLLNILTGMLRPDKGNVFWNERNIYEQMKEEERTKNRNGTIGYMMQGMTLLCNLTVSENLICPLELAGRSYKKNQLEGVLKELDLWAVHSAYPAELSGGEYRRASLARTILMEPEILVADEPTSNLDEKSAGIVRRILTDYCKDGKSVIVATHDMQYIREGSVIHKL